MNLVLIPYKQGIPEWKQCNYDQQRISQTRKFIAYSINYLQKFKNLQNSDHSTSSENSRENSFQKIQQIVQILINQLHNHVENQQKIASTFIQYKIYQVRQKFQEYCSLIQIVKYNSQQMMLLLQNLYIQSYYVLHMAEYNFDLEVSGLQNCNLFIRFANSNLKSQQTAFKLFQKNRIFLRLEIQSQKLTQRIQSTFLIYRNLNKKNHSIQQYFQRQQAKKKRKIHHQSAYIGLFMGGLLAFIGILVMINVANNIVLGQNTLFTQNFPIWRGAAEFIFYIWILGLNVLLYEKADLNFKLIFYYQKYNLPHSKLFFQFASVLSFIYLLLFMLFVLQIADTIPTNFVYYGEVFWLLLLFCFLNPFPILYSRGRFYILKMLVKVIFPCFYPMNFLTIWIAQQIISLTQVLTDFSFTIVFFSTKDYAITVPIVQNINSIIVISAFAYRIFQNLKLWHQISQQRPDKHYDFMAPPFLGFVRALFGFCTAITALVYRLKLFNNALVLWLVFAIFSTIVAWYVDVRGDWGLLIHQKSTLLRSKLFFQRHKKLYFLLIGLDLGLRAAWALTISNFVVYSTGVWPGLFVMFFSFLQIFRRGIWNFLRIQNEHVKNSINYQAIVNDEHILKKLKEKIKNNQTHKKIQQKIGDSLDRLSTLRSTGKFISSNHLIQFEEITQIKRQRMKQQFELFKQYLKRRQIIQNKIQQNIELTKKQMRKMVKQFTIIDFFDFIYKIFSFIKFQIKL